MLPIKHLFTLLLLALPVCLSFCGKPAHASKNTMDKTSNVVPTQNETLNTRKQNSTSEIYAKQQVPVLCYHRIEYGRNDEYTVTPTTFEAQIKLLADSGYHTIGPNEYYNYLVYNDTLPQKPVMITFDDSRVAHATIAAPVLEKYNFRGVFFIMTITYNKKNYMSTEQIATLAKTGHTVALHSWDHTPATKYGNDSILQKNIIEPKKKLEEIIEQKVDYFAYPYGLTNNVAIKRMNDYFKLSFILSTKQDSIYPLQTVRRMIVPEWKPQSLLRAMERTFSRK